MDLISKADLFFISSSHHKSDMDTNHRGGPPGFVRILSNDEKGLALVYPEYSGNRLYQTLGNLQTTPKAGLVIPDFDTGDVLYLTGNTEIFAGKDASDLLAHTNLAVKIQVTGVRFVADGLGFRGQKGELSPYNPPVRYLSVDTNNQLSKNTTQVYAKLIDKKILTPTIGRFKFHIADPEKASQWKQGQYVALSFEDELDIGYSHMRDDDPQSINDDFLRTFTVSSRQDGLDGHDQFEITIRKFGPVTSFLFGQNVRSHLEVPILGFGGEFFIEQGNGQHASFIAGGVGITPLLAQAQDLDLKRLKLYWTVRAADLGLVTDTFERIPSLVQSTKLFVTGTVKPQSKDWNKLEASDATVYQRRLAKEDLSGDPASKYFLCMGMSFRKEVLGWLSGKTAVYEDFHY